MNQKFLITGFLLLIVAQSIELELTPQNNFQTCTVLLSSFDPVNVELRFPAVHNKQEHELFGIKLSKVTDTFHQTYIEMGDNITYHYSYELQSNVPYFFCVQFNVIREIDTVNPIYIGYSAIQDFQHLIGQVQIPKQLAKEENLRAIYHIAKELTEVSTVINTHQEKQRKLEDQIATRNVHKEKRIILFGIIEVCVITLCGVYQIFALRKFLIQKNLY